MKKIFLKFLLISAFLLGYNNVNSTVIIINGVSCVGKSTIAKKILEIAPQTTHYRKAVYFSLDKFFAKYIAYTPLKVCKTFKDFVTLVECQGFVEDMDKRALNSMVWWRFGLWHYDILNYAKANPQVLVIMDTCFAVDRIFENFLYIFKDFKDTWFVKLCCSREVAQERLNKRNAGDDLSEKRELGILNSHFHPITFDSVYENKNYDQEIDSSDKYPDGIADDILIDFCATSGLGAISNLKSNYNNKIDSINKLHNNEYYNLLQYFRDCLDIKNTLE